MTTTTTELTGRRSHRRRRPAADARRRAGGGARQLPADPLPADHPDVFILVTTVFFLMRSTGDPITAALGGRLAADQLAERIHAAGYDRPILVQYFEYLGQRPAPATSARRSATTGPVTEVLAHLRRGDPRAGLLRADRGVRRRHPARHGRRATAATRWPDAVLRVFAILCYATPVFFAGLLLKLVFSVWLGLAAGRRARLAPRTELAAADAADTRPAST